MAAQRGANLRHRAVGEVTVLSADTVHGGMALKNQRHPPVPAIARRREPKVPAGPNRTLPANV